MYIELRTFKTHHYHEKTEIVQCTVTTLTLNTKFLCQMCIKTGWVQLYNDLVCPEKINYIDNKMFGIEQNNEVNARYMADHFWHELSYLQIHNQK